VLDSSASVDGGAGGVGGGGGKPRFWLTACLASCLLCCGALLVLQHPTCEPEDASCLTVNQPVRNSL
jgi:hypothetical protein